MTTTTTTIGGPGGFIETQILAKTPEGREQLKDIALTSGSLAAGALAPAVGAGLGGTALAVGTTRFGTGLALGESVDKARDSGFVEGASTYLVGSVFEKLASMTVSGMKKFMASLAADDQAVTAAQMNLLKEMLKYKKSHSGKFSEAAEQRFKDGLAKLTGPNQPKQIGMDQEPLLLGWNRRLSKGDGEALPTPPAEIPIPGRPPRSIAYAAPKTPKPIDLDAIIRSGDRSVLQYGRNVDERLKWVPPAESFSGVRRTGSAPVFTDIEKRRWADYVRGGFGQEAGDNAARILDDPGFAGFFYPKGYADLSAKYSKMRGLFEDIAVPNEVVVGGSAGMASEGTLFRKVAAPHDLDFGAYISGASKIPYSPSTVDAQVARLSDRSAIESSPIFARLREKFPSLRNAKFRHADYDYQFDIGPNGSYNGDLRYSPDYFTVPMVKPSVSKDGWANRLVTFSVDGEKIDVMLSDAPLGVSRYNPRLGSADAAMGWKRTYTSHGKPRAKDVPDLTGYREYDEDNLMIDPFTGQSQFSSFMFPARSYMLNDGLPRVVEMPIRPGHDLKVPVIMNDKGEFLNLLKPDPVLSWYRPQHPMFRAGNVSATSETHPVVAIRGSNLGKDSSGETAGSIGLYPAEDVATLVNDLLRPRDGNWATMPGNRFKDVIIYPRAAIDPRANPRNAVWDVDAYTAQGTTTRPGATSTELREISDMWTAEASRYSRFPYGSSIPNYPEINSAYRVNLYSENPQSHFSGSPALNIYHGYGEAKSGNVIPADDYVRIPGSLMEKEPEKARSILSELIQRMKFAAPVAAGGTAYGVSESETRQAAMGGDSFRQSRSLFATDRVPPTIFGIPVVSRKEDYTRADLRFFSEHPEAGGYYSMGDEEEEAQGALMKGDIDGGVSRLFDHLKLSEGLRLEAYEDPGDHKPAIAFGAHRIDGKPVYYGQKIDEATALRALSDDVGIRAERLRKLFPKSWGLMDEGTKMALIDVSFGKDDVLSDRPGRSSGLHADLRRAGSDRAKIRSAVMKHYPSYRKSDDPKTLNGLQNRRIMGMKTFFGQDFSYDNKVWDSKLGFVEGRK